VPTEVDILKSRNGSRGVVEHRFLVNGLSIRLIDVGTQSSLRQKWMHKFYNVDAVLFVVDLLSYDVKISDDYGMAGQIWGFEGTISSRWCADTVIILFFNEVSAFRRKLSQKPLGDYFPDYTGSTEDQACEYLLQRFKAVNHGKRKLYSYFVDPYVTSNIELVAAAIEDSRR
jgi:guanine nucleotide-binding protein G(i) subunit alpha